MNFTKPLIPGTLIARKKRFLADIRLDSGENIIGYCPNTGSLKSCTTPGWKVLVSFHQNPKRKYQYTWEMVHNRKCWIGINTMVPNLVTAEAVREGIITELSGYPQIKSEVNYGKNSRIDLLLSAGKKLCYVEVKNVTLVEDDGYYYFPDAVTERGRKHLYELIDVVKSGHRAVMLFFIQRSDGTIFKPAKHIDAAYTEALYDAQQQGVQILAYRAEVSPARIVLSEKVEVTI